MKRKLFVLALLAIGSTGLVCNDASAWGLWRCHGHCMSRYVNVHVSTPYNAFTPFCGGYTHSYGTSNCGPCGWGGGPCCGPQMGWGGFDGCCAMAPNPYLPAPMYAQMPMMPAPMTQATLPYGGLFGFGVQPAAAYMPSYPMSGGEQFPMRNAFGN